MVESFEVAYFLVVHMLHQRFEVGVVTNDHRRLSRVDKSCGELAGLVDAELFFFFFFLMS